MSVHRFGVLFTTILTSLSWAASPALAQTRESVTVSNASSVLDQVMQTPGKEIPHSLLAKAEGVVIIPNMIKGGFVIGARHGHGVALIRNAQGGWDAPRFLQMTGGSVGFQVGVQSTDIVLVFMTKKSVQGLLTGKFTIGADAAAAAGPVGRQLAVATDERLGAEIYSYARSRGLFAGVSLDGSAIRLDPNAETSFYRASPDGNSRAMPQPAVVLIEKVMQYSSDAPVAIPAKVTPNVPAAPITATEHKREQLASAALKLAKFLPQDWQTYLAFPAEVFAGDKHSSVDQLEKLLGRFNKVAQNPQYRRLSEKVEFQETHRLLAEYIALLTTNPVEEKLQLPPVPTN